MREASPFAKLDKCIRRADYIWYHAFAFGILETIFRVCQLSKSCFMLKRGPEVSLPISESSSITFEVILTCLWTIFTDYVHRMTQRRPYLVVGIECVQGDLSWGATLEDETLGNLAIDRHEILDKIVLISTKKDEAFSQAYSYQRQLESADAEISHPHDKIENANGSAASRVARHATCYCWVYLLSWQNRRIYRIRPMGWLDVFSLNQTMPSANPTQMPESCKE
jgi:hypothetical protein